MGLARLCSLLRNFQVAEKVFGIWGAFQGLRNLSSSAASHSRVPCLVPLSLATPTCPHVRVPMDASSLPAAAAMSLHVTLWGVLQSVDRTLAGRAADTEPEVLPITTFQGKLGQVS